MPAFQWIVIALACGVIELLRAGFWFVWVAIAGLITALGIKLGLLSGLTGQVLTFSLSSVVLILFVRPLVIEAIKKSAK
ncbi:MAG TPA: hypothetical protein VN426_08055 [Syntrophomonadaceae bacterium]|nr:hypothetical protein [Syntrophomonadaceae bacterium]